MEPPGKRLRRSASLALHDGRSLPLHNGGSLPLTDVETFVVGRADSSHLQVKGKLISRRHAVIKVSGGGCQVEDAGSSNGSWLNDERLEAGVAHALADGDRIMLGSPMLVDGGAKLTFHDSGSGAAGLPLQREAAEDTGSGSESVDSEEDVALREHFLAIERQSQAEAQPVREPHLTVPPPAHCEVELQHSTKSAPVPEAENRRPVATDATHTAAGGSHDPASSAITTPWTMSVAGRVPLEAPEAPSSMDGFVAKPRINKQLVASRSAQWLEGADGGQLARKWGAPPFSILDARKGYWKERRKYWEVEYQIRSEEGRKDNLIGYKGLGSADARGTSVFCPVLCELVYRWFVPAGGSVLDPFAGGSVRGCVAARLGLPYTGVDLSEAQVGENRRQAEQMATLASQAKARWSPPTWHAADARLLDDLRLGGLGSGRSYDAVFSCPPYFDLERYSDDPRDLSEAPSYEAFLAAYREIIGKALRRLAPNRFACFVVGEIRDADGFCRNFVGETIAAFEAHGARLYNHAIMMFPLHSLPMRINSQFSASAKLGMSHQHVLVFFNGRQPSRDIKSVGLHNADRPLEWY